LVARQSIPRFDLYAELGIPPSAEGGEIEAAYRSIILRWDPEGEAQGGDRRIVRARLAREWLTDSERRSRYDASRARAANRAAGTATPRRRTGIGVLDGDAAAAAEAGAAAEAAEAAAGAEAAAAELAETTPAIPWPTADLERLQAAYVGRSPGSRRPRGALLGVGLVIAALLVVLGAGAVILSTRPAATQVAVVTPTSSPAPSQTQLAATPIPTTAITAPPPTEVPIDTAALQKAAWETIQALATAAAAGDVDAAQAMLGDTAPGLRASGLKRATFPDTEAGAISITGSAGSFVAVAGTDRLTSIDGVTWTFDYADRPLAAYKSPSGEPVHDLWWVESDGEHHLYLRVTVATISRFGVTAKVTWSYDPSRPDDATYFQRSALVISSAALDDTPITVTGTALPMAGVTTLTPTATFTDAATLPERLSIGINVTNPRSADGSDRAIESVFKLLVR
jgi:hypothetical protein